MAWEKKNKLSDRLLYELLLHFGYVQFEMRIYFQNSSR